MSIYIPNKVTTRWWFTKQAGHSNAGAMARLLYELSNEEKYKVYANVFYYLKEAWNKDRDNVIILRAIEVIHDYAAHNFISAVRDDFGERVAEILVRYIFLFTESKYESE